MKEGKKLKSILVVMTMLLAALTAGIVLMGSVSAVAPTAFSITAPTASATVTGIVNITWNVSVNYTGTVVYIDGIEVTNTSNLYYNWNTFFDRHQYGLSNTHTISIRAYNDTGWVNRDNATYATNDNLTVTVKGTPGVDLWEYASTSIFSGVARSADIINTSTSLLKYDRTGDIKVSNGSALGINWGSDTYYLYYPVYTGDASTTYNLNWSKYNGYGTGTLAPQIVPSVGNDIIFGDSVEKSVELNRSGLWLIDNDGTHDISNSSQMDATIPAWFWVNTSQNLTSSVSDATFEYDAGGSVKTTTSEVAMVAIYAEYDNRLVDRYSAESVDHGADGIYVTYNKNSSVFLYAGNYTAHAYVDKDGYEENGTVIYYYEPAYYYKYFNQSYGSKSMTSDIMSQASYYNYTFCGPWDPPEVNASKKAITVTSTSPDFPGAYSVNNGNVTEVDSVAAPGNYTLIATWTNGSTGTWTIMVRNSSAHGDGVTGDGNTWLEEWNGTAEFQVVSAPGLQIKVIDDGDGDNDLEVPAGPPSAGHMAIEFQVVNSTHDYYGNTVTYGTEAMAMKNITISGDACLLSGKTLYELDQIGSGIVTISDNTWTVNLIPKMDTAANGGGEITISADWEDHGGTADPVTIQVGGSDYNGSLVSISPAEITINEDVTLTVTVTDPSSPSYGYNSANVTLYWMNNSGHLSTWPNKINHSGTGTTAGEYTFIFNGTQQTTWQVDNVSDWTYFKANRYIVAKADISNGEYGYASAKLVPNHNLKATVEAYDKGSPSTSTMMAGRDYDYMYFNVSIVNSTGGVIGYPIIGTGQNELQFEIYNETGHNVTTSIGASPSFDTWRELTLNSGDANLSLSGYNHYITKPGTYTVYVYNNTYDSKGHNATLEVKQVEVTCTKINDADVTSPAFIWKYDNNVSATFTATYEGEPVNGTLVLDNITDVGSYNKTWKNCSFDGTGTPALGNCPGGNVSIQLTKSKGFVNGVVTVYNITASYLDPSKAQRNITFWLKSDKSGSQYARVAGVLPVKIPDVTPTPASIPYNEEAELDILVTGRGTELEDVFISINVPGLDETNTTTDAQGIATFAFVPRQTGDIIIKVENRTSETVVKVTSWKLYLDVPTSVNENSSFTATARNKSATGDGVEGVTITFNKQTYTTVSDGTVTINTPSVADSANYPITATKEGYAETSDEIKILNVPKLSITTSGTKSPVTVTVYSDAGGLITGATVTFSGKTYTTVNGQTTITVEKDTTGTITATFTGFQDATPVSITIKAAGIPGFELLTLIAALGVAFILLRRRRH